MHVVDTLSLLSSRCSLLRYIRALDNALLGDRMSNTSSIRL